MKKKLVIRNEQIANRACEIIRGLDFSELHEVIVRPHKDRRSLAQNNTFHGWMQFVSEKVGESHGKYFAPEDWKEYFKGLLLGQEAVEINGRIVARTRKTSELNVKDMAEFMDKVDQHCVQEFKIYLPIPGEEG